MSLWRTGKRERADQAALGFSLVEMLVALLFISVLMAGMLRVFASTVQNFQTTNEVISTQRTNRWAMAMLMDDLESMGHFFPMRPTPAYINISSTPVFQVLPNNSITFNSADPTATPGYRSLTLARNSAKNYAFDDYVIDDLRFILDQPLTVTATLRDPILGVEFDGVVKSTCTLNIPTIGSLSDAQVGDIVMIMDPNWESALITAVDTTTRTITVNATAGVLTTGLGVSSGFQKSHLANAEVMLIRPLQLVRYSVQPLNMDPSSTIQVPCLVRQQIPYPTSGTADWTGVAMNVVSENVIGFRADFSLDGGQTWARTSSTAGGANNVDTLDPTTGWTRVIANANAQISARATYNSISDPNNPLWFRYTPAVIRVDVISRTTQARAEYAASLGSTNAVEFGRRRQTLTIVPKNFGMGL